MSTPYQFIALRRLTSVVQQTRKLHMTGSATYPSKYLTNSKPFAPRVDKVVAADVTERSGRKFNTSRELKSNKDTSTMDFTYLPDLEAGHQIVEMRMPRFGDSTKTSPSSNAHESTVARPVISALALDTPFSAMSDVHDNNAVNIDFHTVTEQVNLAASKATQAMKEATQHKAGTLRSMWNGIVGDMMGGKQATVPSRA